MRALMCCNMHAGNALCEANESGVEPAAWCLQIGPRLELQIVKIHEGLASGRVLFHRFDKRSVEDAAAQQEDAEAREQLRAERRREQEENVRRKAAEARREQLAKEVRVFAAVRSRLRWLQMLPLAWHVCTSLRVPHCSRAGYVCFV